MDYSTHNALQRYYFFINGESIYLYFFKKTFTCMKNHYLYGLKTMQISNR